MTVRGFRALRGASLQLSLFILLSPIEAQEITAQPGPLVQGAVTAEESGMPLAAVAVTLFGGDGDELLTVLTDDQGRYSLRAPASGVYRLRAERTDYHPRESGPFTLQATDTLPLDFQLFPALLLLDSILVSGQRRNRPLRAGEQLVYGRLLDDAFGEPIPQGLIRLLGESGPAAATTLSDDEGLFWLVSPSAGTYRLQAERIGYKTSTGPVLYLMLGDTIGLDFYLSVEAVLLNPIVVRAAERPWEDRYDLTGLEGFLRRYSTLSRAGFGEFLTRDSIAEYEDRVITSGHMLLQSMTSVRNVVSGGLGYGQVILRQGCIPHYFLNGTLVPPDAVDSGQINPMAIYPPETLEAVEVYVRPTIPAEFLQGGFPCGVVALWARQTPDPDSEARTWKKWAFALGVLTLVLASMR